MEDLARAVEIQLRPPTRLGRIIAAITALALSSLLLWSFLSDHKVIGGFLLGLLLLQLVIVVWLERRRRNINVDSEGVRVTFNYGGEIEFYQWNEISHVEVELHGLDKDDMDFCHHVTLVTKTGKKIRTDDHAAMNYPEFVAALKNFLPAESHGRKLDEVIKRYAEVKRNGAD